MHYPRSKRALVPRLCDVYISSNTSSGGTCSCCHYYYWYIARKKKKSCELPSTCFCWTLLNELVVVRSPCACTSRETQGLLWSLAERSRVPRRKATPAATAAGVPSGAVRRRGTVLFLSSCPNTTHSGSSTLSSDSCSNPEPTVRPVLAKSVLFGERALRVARLLLTRDASLSPVLFHILKFLKNSKLWDEKEATQHFQHGFFQAIR